MENEADVYMKQVRKFLHVIKDQLIELQQLCSSHEVGSRENDQISEIIEQLQQEEERFSLILRSHMSRKIKRTIQEHRESQEAQKKPALRLVK